MYWNDGIAGALQIGRNTVTRTLRLSTQPDDRDAAGTTHELCEARVDQAALGRTAP